MEDCGLFFERSKDIVLFVREDGSIADANQAALEAYGYSRQELLSMTIHDLRAPDTRPLVDLQMAQAAVEGAVFETVHRRRDGSTFPVEVGSQGFEIGGRLILISFVRDITRRKRDEEALRASEANYRAIFDAANDAIFVHDLETGRILDVNRKMGEMYGYTREEALRLTVGDLSIGEPPYDQAGAQRWINRAAQGEPQVFEWLAKDKGGRLFWVEVNLKRVVLSGQSRMLAIVRDISERKRAEEERQRLFAQAEVERKRLQALIETAPAGIIFVEAPDGQPIFVNKAAETILGRPFDRTLPLANYPEYYGMRQANGGPLAAEEQPLMRSLRGETLTGLELLIRRPSGEEASILSNSAPILGGTGRAIGAVMAFQDITDLRRQERMRDEFLSAAAHELKTPVTTIKGYAQLLHKWAPEGHEPREAQAVAVINAQCDRINRRVQEMMEVVRLRTVSTELPKIRFDLARLVSEVAQRVQATTQIHRLSVVTEQPVIVEADRERIEEVLMSILENAIKYSPNGGEILAQVKVSRGEAIVTIKDQGVGIPAERQPHIFEPFYEPMPAGTSGYRSVVALSLYLSQLTIERHHGRIWFESEEGKGSTFSFSLPLADARGNGQAD